MIPDVLFDVDFKYVNVNDYDLEVIDSGVINDNYFCHYSGNFWGKYFEKIEIKIWEEQEDEPSYIWLTQENCTQDILKSVRKELLEKLGNKYQSNSSIDFMDKKIKELEEDIATLKDSIADSNVAEERKKLFREELPKMEAELKELVDDIPNFFIEWKDVKLTYEEKTLMVTLDYGIDQDYSGEE